MSEAYTPSTMLPPGAEAPGSPEPAEKKPITPWRIVKGTVIFLVVAWHLFFFVVRNPLDLWNKPIKEYIKSRWPDPWQSWGEQAYDISDHLTNRFANFTGCEQRWVMFSPPMARGASFIGVRLEFSDGSTHTIPSPNEPENPARYFRFGGWQTRKHEECLFEVPAKSDDEFPIWQAFIRHKARAWKEKHRDDPREMKRVVLIKRRIEFPAPEDQPGFYRAAATKDIATFDPEGDLLP